MKAILHFIVIVTHACCQTFAQDGNYEKSPGFCLTPHVEFGTIIRFEGKETYVPGAEITIRCDERHQLRGHATVRCLPNGRWEPLPYCVDASSVRGCTTPKAPYLRAIGQQVKKTTYRTHESIRFRCEDGYFLRGSREAKCLGNNKWDAALPKCSKTPSFCKFPEELKMGSYRPSQKEYGVGQKITWKCNNNHVLRGAKYSVCSERGVFHPPKPTCEPFSGKRNLRGKYQGQGGFNFKKLACSRPPPTRGLVIHPKSRYHPVGKEVEYSCLRGYHLLGSARSVCTRQGFTSDPPKCKRVECPPPSLPKHGRLLGEGKELYYYGAKLQYACAENHLMTGSPYTKCRDSGKFYPGPPTCSPPSCRYECDYKEGRPCQCDRGCRFEKNCCYDFEQHCRKLYY